MATGGSGAVFFLGTRAHYQVLNQPESHFDVENGNASTETIYQNPSVPSLWPRDQNQSASSVQALWPRDQNQSASSVQSLWPRDQNQSASSVQSLWPRDQNQSASSVQALWPRDQNQSTTSIQELWPREQKLELDNERWYCDQTEVRVTDERDKLDDNVKKSRRRPSETALCEKDDMKPALLNAVGDSPPQKKCAKTPLLTFLWSLARRKRKLDTDEIQYLHHIDTALTSCTYRESCRCLDCQSRYFECDDSEEEYSSDDSYVPRYVAQQLFDTQDHVAHQQLQEEEEDDDEVFIDTVPGDNTSTDLLLDTNKMSVSSDETTELTQSEAEHNLQLEVAAGTPVFLNYLLTHPITCAIQ